MGSNWFKRWALVIAVLFFAGCGGGGGSTSSSNNDSNSNNDNNNTPTSTVLSGVAAAGAPIIGFAYLKDSTGTMLGPEAIDTDGSFSFDVDGLTPPFILQAQGSVGGEDYVLHSVALGAGTANINPLTNLAVAVASGGQDPSHVYDAGDFSSIDQDSVNAAIASIQTALAPLLEAASVVTENTVGSFDPIQISYVADPSQNPLDALFDAVSINVAAPATTGDSATVTVTNKAGDTILPGTSTTSASLDNSTTSTTVSNNQSVIDAAVQTATDAQQIVSFLQSWGDTINAKGTSLTDSDLDSFYVGSANDPTAFGIQDGFDRTNTIASLVDELTQNIIPSMGQITSMSNFAIIQDLTNSSMYKSNNTPIYNKVYRISADFTFTSGNFGNPGHLTVAQATAGGSWQLIGDGFLTDVKIHPYADYNMPADGTTNFTTGLYVYLDDQGNQGVNSALLEGPGLPTGGLPFTKAQTYQSSDTRLALAEYYDTSSHSLGDNWGEYEMTDSQIAAFEPRKIGAYTLKFFSGASVPADGTTGLLQILHPIIGSRPVTNANLDANLFGTFSLDGLTHDISSLSALVGTTQTFTYSLPTNYTVAWGNFDLDLWNNQVGAGGVYFGHDLKVDETSTSFIIAADSTNVTPNQGRVSLDIQAASGREFRTNWQLTGSSTTTTSEVPTNVQATAGDGQVSISWQGVSNANYYNVYYSTSSGVDASTGTLVMANTDPVMVTGLTNGTIYYFVVTAVNSSGIESMPSNEVSATPTTTITPSGPYIQAMVLSLAGGTNYLPWLQTVQVCSDSSCSSPITDATVTVNGQSLVYTENDQDYEGNIDISAGDIVSLSVTVSGTDYTASGTQFNTFPTITSGNTWTASSDNSVTWSAGAPTSGATYAVGVMDATGDFVYPAGNKGPAEVAIGSTSTTIPADTLTAGNNYILLVGIGTQGIAQETSGGISISGAASGSGLWIGGLASFEGISAQ